MSTAIAVRRNEARTRGTSTVYDLVVSGERVAIVRKVEGTSRMITPTHWRLRFAGAEKDVDYKFWTRASAVEYARREMEKR